MKKFFIDKVKFVINELLPIAVKAIPRIIIKLINKNN